jgi:hypothetical protein
MHHIHITHDKAAEFLRACDNLVGFIDANSIMGQLIIAMRAALAADGVSVDVWQGDTSIPKNTLETDDVYNSCPACGVNVMCWSRHVTRDIEMHIRALEHLANVANEIRRNSSCVLPHGIHTALTDALAATGRK